MRGQEKKQTSMLVLRSPEDFVPKKHPIRRIKQLADDVLRTLSPTLDAMYAEGGRPSIPPERLLKATILMALYTVRSERQFSEQLNYNLLLRWFLDMDMTEEGWEHSSSPAIASARFSTKWRPNSSMLWLSRPSASD